jgi:thioredoxin-related protein
MNGISEDITYYKVAEDAETYEKLVNKKKTITMAVFGRDNCFYCNQFKAVYNTVAEEYNLDIYYFDSLSYDEDEYQKIMDLGLKIPASCTDGDEDALLSDGFSTPVTLFTKNGKVIDCISGYTNKATLITKLETVGMIKSED